MNGATRDTTAGYRPDIDGLRTLAVTAVVLFHAGVGALPGGFVGVDIFFVISGYLIGGHIFSEVRGGGFSFAGFYARRLRRILPALFAMLVVTYLAGLVLLTPIELRELGKEAIPTVFGVSNLLFYTGGGYFAPAAEYDPLLMTWSLGVEEQFYLLFPFVMIALGRFRARGELWALIALSILSFAASQWMMRHDPSGAFYLLPPRAWELGIGAALAVWERRRGASPLSPGPAQAIGAIGAAMLVSALMLYRPSIAFPGYFALLPTVGAAMMIAAGPAAAINRHVLSLAPVVFVGRISYSWYLWHWPLFYFNRVLEMPVDPGWLVLASLLLAILSYRFVEQPFRRRILPRRRVLLAYPVAALAVALPAAAFFVLKGVPQRLPAVSRVYAEQAKAARGNPCLAPYGASAPLESSRCLPPLAPGEQGRLLLIGDSHASALAPGMATVARDAGLGFGEMTKSSCLPLIDYARPMPERASHWGECMAFQRAVFAYIAAHPEVRVVALTGYWQTGMTVRGEAGDRPLRVPLATTIERLRSMGRRVLLIQDAPGFHFDPYARVVGSTLPLRAWLAGGGRSAEAGDPVRDWTRPILSAVAARYPGTLLLDPHRDLCSAAGACRYRAPGALYYFDPQHLTAPGAAVATRGAATLIAGKAR